jgi:DNA processing protein
VFGEVSITSDAYPKLLKQISGAPERLYYKGVWREEMFDHCVSIVGTRSSTPYGEKAVRYLISGLDPKVTVVSGFMTGIDRVAHLAALERGLSTIGVLPCGINLVFPPSNRDIYNSILDKSGLLLSEYPDNFAPRKWTFLKRNSIVSGLSRIIIVAEASLGSGSLHTASLAKVQNKVLGAIPGNIFNKLSEGSHKIISTGGHLITEPSQINALLGFEQTNYSLSSAPVLNNSQFMLVLNALKNEDLSFEQLHIATRLSVDCLNKVLTRLELGGEILERNGRFYVG